MQTENLSQNVNEEIANKNFTAHQLDPIKNWPKELIELIFSFKFGKNKILQLIEILNEISLRDNMPIDNPLKSSEWLCIYNNPKMPIFQKGLWLRQFLFSKRYPIYSEFRNRIKDKSPTLENGNIECLSKEPCLALPELDNNSHKNRQDKPPHPSLSPVATGERIKVRGQRDMDNVSASKKNLCYAIHKGKFLKKCPGTPNYLCCNYYVLNIQTNCDYDCQYCILQGYINNDRLNIYANLDTALKEMKDFLNAHPLNFYRIGTGELTDSLSLDYITKTSVKLIPFFLEQRNALLELKTKSKNIENLLKFNPKGNIVISWSLNPQRIIDEYENGAASLKERLESAMECAKNNYRIGFHLDPVILYSKWESDYNNLIAEIFDYVKPDEIAWISIAGFRYTSSLKNVILKRFPNTKLFLGEMIRCGDGKYRYIRPIRVYMYKRIINWIKWYGKDIPIYFCMESPDVWRDAFGKLPFEISNLKNIFD